MAGNSISTCSLSECNNGIVWGPSKKSVKAFLDNIRGFIKSNKTAKTENLIRQLNAKIRGWANYYRHVVSKRTFAYIANGIYLTLMRWVKHRHPDKSGSWQRKKYFRRQGFRNWIFFARTHDKEGNLITLDLFKASATPIKRHIKIKGAATPYNPLFRDYFELRKRSKTNQSPGYGRFAHGLLQF